jgi:hypothetical protein
MKKIKTLIEILYIYFLFLHHYDKERGENERHINITH